MAPSRFQCKQCVTYKLQVPSALLRFQMMSSSRSDDMQGEQQKKALLQKKNLGGGGKRLAQNGSKKKGEKIKTGMETQGIEPRTFAFPDRELGGSNRYAEATSYH